MAQILKFPTQKRRKTIKESILLDCPCAGCVAYRKVAPVQWEAMRAWLLDGQLYFADAEDSHD